jgi:hypothetical protein
MYNRALDGPDVALDRGQDQLVLCAPCPPGPRDWSVAAGEEMAEQEEGGGCNEDNNEWQQASTWDLPCHAYRHHHCSHLCCGGTKDDQSGIKPMICRGTHAKVRAMERATDAFLSLDAPPSLSLSPSSWSRGRRRRDVIGDEFGNDSGTLRHRHRI